MINDEMTDGGFWEKNIGTTPGDIRPTLKDYALSRKNNILNIGYDYRGKVFSKTLSGLLFADEKRKALLDAMEVMVNYLIDSVKSIKRNNNFAMHKKWRDFN